MDLQQSSARSASVSCTEKSKSNPANNCSIIQLLITSNVMEGVSNTTQRPRKCRSVGGVMGVKTVFQEVLKTVYILNGLCCGLRKADNVLDKREAHLCVLAGNCDEAQYVNLLVALCPEHQINPITVDDNKKLGEWVGLCKIDREEKPHKVLGCSSVVVKDHGKGSQAKDVIDNYFRGK
ncbi:small ribosomal subunit protein eS12-like [Scyliorhinus torazame]|uniref:small ribosomal subunit protein eS12-like n=1 Tax=Scyliorhinus torazame TaxID=75743 RepID=UPI003B58ECB9